MKSLQDTYTLSNGVEIPIVGFGTWQTPNDATGYNAVKHAIEVGYRHIDTAAAYGNEEEVGRAIQDSGVAREAIFLTTKLWNNVRGYEETKVAIDKSMNLLGVDYLDLYLIHWPNPLAFRDCWEEKNAETWRAIEEYYQAGKIKAIGVSNFMPRHLDALKKTAKVLPHVNQVRLCPGDVKEDLVAYCKADGILLEAYSPLGTGKVFQVEAIGTLAEKYTVSVAKLCLRWNLQMGFVPLPKSVTPERIESNADLFDFSISQEDVDALTNMTGCCGISESPDERNF